MKRNSFIVIIISILLIISVGLNIYGYYSRSRIEASQKANQYTENLEQYNKLIKSINEQFKLDGYKEVLGRYNHMLALPLKAGNDDLLNRQKLFVFKSDVKNAVILLNVSVSKYNGSSNNEWNHSFDYLPRYFNTDKESSLFKESYNPNLPLVQVASNSFNHRGCNLSLIAFSNDNNHDQSVAAEELISCSNLLIEFIQNKKE